MNRAAKASLSLIAVTSLLCAGAASAAELNLLGGYFSPWEGGTRDDGWLAGVQLLTFDPDSHLRWGGEIEYRKYEQQFRDISNIEVQDVVLNGVLHYRFFPEKITPYLGGGLGLGLTIIDRAKLRNSLSLFQTLDLNKVGFLLGGYVVAGVEFPIGRYLGIFIESRAGAYARLENDKKQSNFRNSSGWDVRSGVKLRF